MKKKMIFVVISMNVGGTEKALLNMISEIPEDQYDITILMMEEYGGFLSAIPDHIHLEYLKEYGELKELLNNPPQITASKLARSGRLLKAAHILFLHAASKIMKDRSVFLKYLLKEVPELITEYDVAAAYAGPMDFISFFVVEKIRAKKKIQWIHFDITKIGFDTSFAAKKYCQFDKIFVVSEEGKKKVTKLLPAIQNKTDVFSNILSKELVLSMAEQGAGFQDEFKGVRILTVGRLSKEKGQDLLITVAAKLKQERYDIRWYCMGEGKARKEYEEQIKEKNLKKDFVLLGAHPNPYPFMKQCDIYVQPSRHEGYCITLAEARCFDNPIVCTDFTGANEQILNEKNGLVVPFDGEQMYLAIKQLLNDEKKRTKIKENLQTETVDTRSELEKLYRVADGF